MDFMTALNQWWADPDAVIVPAGQPEKTIDWLKGQTPETWHQVVMTWNYDYGDKVLTWILNQENCDRGTAARIFHIEGFGHWLHDIELADDKNHVCNVALANWHRYKKSELKHNCDVVDWADEWIKENASKEPYEHKPIQEILVFEGKRDAISKYGSEDGKIVVSLEHWLKLKGLAITS